MNKRADFLVELGTEELPPKALRTLEEVRMLSGVESTKEKVLRIILAGQPDLNEKLDSPELIQLAQRVRLRFHLTALSEQDMHAYVLHRLEVAGSGGRRIFDESVFPLLYRYSGGVPRLVNQLCDLALVYASSKDHQRVQRLTVQQVLDDGVFFAGGVLPSPAPMFSTVQTGKPE